MDHGAPRWVAMIEEDTNRQQNGRQIVESSLATTYGTEDEARAAAWDLAHHHNPRHPWTDRGRTVVHHDDFTYTVLVHGATQGFHFRVQVGLVYTQDSPRTSQGFTAYGDPLPD
jgi:hypothetical protein